MMRRGGGEKQRARCEREKGKELTAVESLTRCAAATCCARCVGTLGPAVAFGFGGYGVRGAVRRRCALRAGGEKETETKRRFEGEGEETYLLSPI